jgi:hypothetical protein
MVHFHISCLQLEATGTWARWRVSQVDTIEKTVCALGTLSCGRERSFPVSGRGAHREKISSVPDIEQLARRALSWEAPPLFTDI